MGGADLQLLSSLYEEAPSTRRPSLRSAAGAGNEGITSLGYKSIELFSSAILLNNYSTCCIS